MNESYVSLIFFGLFLLLFFLACIVVDKKKLFNFSKRYDDKKQEIVEIIDDADQMIEELNKFSEYIVNQMDLKNEELNKNLELAEGKINALDKRADEICEEINRTAQQKTAAYSEYIAPAHILQEQALQEQSMQAQSMQAQSMQISNLEATPAFAVNGGVLNTAASAAPAAAAASVAAGYSKPGNNTTYTNVSKREKVIPINNKYSEVIRLSQEGMQELEIAKRLKIGKGEVELILGLRK